MFVKDELITIFTAERLLEESGSIRSNKLAYINNHYIKHADPRADRELAIPHLQRRDVCRRLSAEQQAWAKPGCSLSGTIEFRF